MVVCTFVGARCGPRPRFITGGPSISSDQGGLSLSLTLALKFFGFCNVVARFILFRLAQGDDVGTLATLGVDQDDDLLVQPPECHETLFVVAIANVFARYGEVVPNRLAANEIKAMNLDVSETLPFVPRGHMQIVVTISRAGKRVPWAMSPPGSTGMRSSRVTTTWTL